MAVLDGVIVALVTPLDRAGRVDHVALRQLVERLAGRGVTGISPLGSTGEGYSLSLEQRLAAVGTVAGAVPGGMPVIPGVFAHNHEQAVAEIAAYADHGGTAVLAAPPSYYPMAAAEQQAFFSRVADAAALPLVLYNVPRFTKVQIAPLVAAALAAHPRVAGLKDSSGDLGYGTELLDAVAVAGVSEEFSVLTGIDSLLVSYLLAGARGTICASANVVPELVRDVYDAVREGKLEEALRREARLRAVNAACGAGALPAAFKAAVAAAGIGGPWLVPPRQPLTEAQTATLLDRLTALDAL
ncbi:MAG TPA: dihydrodipicolinate synthase family protein [Trebonia sp.]|nr:dihydrodipicolinate synthase family protein [Trebonia sp.]